MQTVYVVTHELEYDGIQQIISVWDTENAAKAHIAQLSKGKSKHEIFDYEDFVVESAITATPEPGSASANESQA